jgi:putative tryptophan/tyrosine transport system substrate-binding protein
MLRRQILAGSLAAAMWPVTGRAQAARKMARVGFLGGTTPDAEVQRNFVEPFRQTLRELGHEEGRNLTIDFRWAEGKPERLPALTAELLALGPDVLVAMGPRPAYAAKAATGTVPIVAAAVDDPVLMGLAATMARPGGNVTGVSSWGFELVAKRLQLLRDMVPAVRRVGILVNPLTGSPANAAAWTRTLAEFEQRLGITILEVAARGPDEFDAAFATLARERAGGLLVLADALFYIHRVRLGELCAKARLPSVWGEKSYLLEGGGLASYQSDFSAISRRAAAMADRILKGAKPGEMPFEQATKLELVVNLRAAKALGITVPQSLLVSADEVIR